MGVGTVFIVVETEERVVCVGSGVCPTGWSLGNGGSKERLLFDLRDGGGLRLLRRPEFISFYGKFLDILGL